MKTAQLKSAGAKDPVLWSLFGRLGLYVLIKWMGVFLLTKSVKVSQPTLKRFFDNLPTVEICEGISILHTVNISNIPPITEEDGRKLKYIYIDLILKISVFLVFT